MAIQFRDKDGKKHKAQPAKPKGETKGAAKAKPSPKAKAKGKTKDEPGTALALVGQDAEIAALRSLDDFRQAGNVILRRTAEAWLQFANLVAAAKERLTPEEFDQLGIELRFAQSTARQYIVTAKSERLRKLKESGSELPASSHSLYLVASMDDDQWKAFNKEQKLTRDTSTATLRQFLVDYKDSKAIANKPKTTRQAAEEAASSAATEATAPGPEDAGQLPEDEGGDEGSPTIADPGEGTIAQDVGEGQERPIDLFRDFSNALVNLQPSVIASSMEASDEPADMIALATQLAEHADTIRSKLNDREFELQGQ